MYLKCELLVHSANHNNNNVTISWFDTNLSLIDHFHLCKQLYKKNDVKILIFKHFKFYIYLFALPSISGTKVGTSARVRWLRLRSCWPGIGECQTGDLKSSTGRRPLKTVTSVQKLKFTKCCCFLFTCEFACKMKFP